MCHVIASGYSAIDAYKRGVVKENDYVIGFNFAAFLPYRFDFYFCEDNSHDDDYGFECTKEQLLLLNKCRNNISNLFFKNIYSSKCDCFELLNKSSINYSIVLDKQVYTEIIDKLFAKPKILMPQYYTTTITATMLAYHAGFRKIVIHGLDFGGDYLFQSEELQKRIEMDAPLRLDVKANSTYNSKQEWIWPKLIKKFSKKNIKIYCASQDSRFKEYAELYLKTTL